MKLSDLIDELEGLKSEHGDVTVVTTHSVREGRHAVTMEDEPSIEVRGKTVILE